MEHFDSSTVTATEMGKFWQFLPPSKLRFIQINIYWCILIS